MSDELDERSVYVNDCEGDCADAATGVTLLREDVAKARMEEMSRYDKFQAYEEVTDETCMMKTGRKPISCRWRDINKSDSERVEVGSRSRNPTLRDCQLLRRNSTAGIRRVCDKHGCNANQDREKTSTLGTCSKTCFSTR